MYKKKTTQNTGWTGRANATVSKAAKRNGRGKKRPLKIHVFPVWNRPKQIDPYGNANDGKLTKLLKHWAWEALIEILSAMLSFSFEEKFERRRERNENYTFELLKLHWELPNIFPLLTLRVRFLLFFKLYALTGSLWPKVALNWAHHMDFIDKLRKKREQCL